MQEEVASVLRRGEAKPLRVSEACLLRRQGLPLSARSKPC